MTTITSILDCTNYLGEVGVVIFDLDDTLYSEKAYVRSGYEAVAAAFGRPELADKLWAAFEQHLPAVDVVFEREGLATAENKEKALRTYRYHNPKIRLYPGVRSLLEKLSKGKKLGMITDGRPEGQRAKIKALQIEQYFNHIIVTDELGGVEFRKPNETAFCMMQRMMNVPFEKMVYIGDNIKKDFIAPEKLGMRTIYFNNTDGLYRIML